MMILYGQIYVLIAVTILECCLVFADMQYLFLSSEQIVAHGPLINVCSLFFSPHCKYMMLNIFDS